jgi:N-terminal domain of reverse transcriptase
MNKEVKICSILKINEIDLYKQIKDLKKGNKIQLCANHKRFLSLDNKAKTNKKPESWHEIDWKKAWEKIKILQEEITIATQKKDYKEVYNKQWTLLNSFSGKALAVRKVIQNSGGKTPGMDKIIWKNTKDYMNAINDLGNIVRNP